MSEKGEHTEQTFGVNILRQMLVFVRFKPAFEVTASAMLDGVTSAVDSAVDSIESAAAAIPGLNLFFKEEEEPEKKLDKEYNFYEDYSAWDQYIDTMKEEMKNLHPDNVVLVHEFEAKDADSRKSEGAKLYTKMISETSDWNDEDACFHFIGIGQGGNVANEAISKLCGDQNFQNSWYVQSVIYIGTPLYKNLHTFEPHDAFKNKGKSFSFGNAYDLTHNAISFFEPNDQLLKMIAESNSNLISVFTGKIKAQLVTTLGKILSALNFGTGSDNEGNLKKLAETKDDVQGLVKECMEAVKSLIDVFPQWFKPDDFSGIKKIVQGYDKVPKRSGDRLKKSLEELKKVYGGGMSLSTSNVNKGVLFNFLCPAVDQLTESLKALSFGEGELEAIIDKLIEKSGVKKILEPSGDSTTLLAVDPYISKVIEMSGGSGDTSRGSPVEDGEIETPVIDRAALMVKTAVKSVKEVTKDGDLKIDSNLDKEQKAKIGEAFTAMIMPMLPTKRSLYGKVLEILPLGGLTSFLEGISADKALEPLKGWMSSIDSQFDFDKGTDEEPGLKTSMENFNKELERIRGYFDKNNFPVHKEVNSLYFIYNSHNLMLKKTYGDILYTIDKESGYLKYKEDHGFSNTHNLEVNSYTPNENDSSEDEIKPTKTLKEEEA